MKNVLAGKHNLLSLLRFTLPTIVMMVFMSMYTMVDGVFVSRFVGTDALSAVNIVYPAVSVMVAVGIMLATGGSAIISAKMGEQKNHEAKQDFSLVTIVGVVLALLMTVGGLVFITPMLTGLGATSGKIFDYCYSYTSVLVLFAPFGVLQMLFQFFFVAAGKPGLGLIVTVMGGAANIVLDYLFIVPLDMGIAGAALATGIGYMIPAVFGIFYFALRRRGTLYFVKPRMDWRVVLDSCTNGSSEMVTNLSMAVITFLFNMMMMKYLGEDGVAAITVVLYTQYLLTAVYLGYSSGVAPIISYNYGDDNRAQLHSITKISLRLIVISSAVTFAAAIVLDRALVGVFAPPGTNVFDLATHGFQLFAVGYLFMGVNIFASSLFTALSNGRISALLSFLRTFVFIVAAAVLLPIKLGVDGVWLAIPAAELLALLVAVFYLIRLRGRYGY